MAHIDNFKGWAESIRQDIDAFKALLEFGFRPRVQEARRCSAAVHGEPDGSDPRLERGDRRDYVELEDEIKSTVPIVVNDPVDAELRLKAYLTHKLQ